MDLNYTIYKNTWIYSGPIDKEICLSSDHIRYLLSKGGLLVRNLYDFDTASSVFWYVIKDSDSDDYCGHNTQKRIQKSLSLLSFERIEKNRFPFREAYFVMNANYQFYKTKQSIPSYSAFEERFKQMDDSYDLWIARENGSGELVAWSIRRRCDNYCEYQTIKANPKYFSTAFPFYGMYYVCNEYYLKTLHLKFVCDGARSVTNHSNVQNFLEEKFNFRKAYCQLNVVYQWWLKPIVNVLFPFRKIIPNNKIKALLNLEAMKRGLI